MKKHTQSPHLAIIQHDKERTSLETGPVGCLVSDPLVHPSTSAAKLSNCHLPTVTKEFYRSWKINEIGW